jgi:hypothetical protein
MYSFFSLQCWLYPWFGGFWSLVYFETRSHYVAQAGLKLTILLPLPPAGLDYIHHHAQYFFVFGVFCFVLFLFLFLFFFNKRAPCVAQADLNSWFLLPGPFFFFFFFLMPGSQGIECLPSMHKVPGLYPQHHKIVCLKHNSLGSHAIDTLHLPISLFFKEEKLGLF